MERVAAARPRWIPATVLLRELQEADYAGGIRQLKAFLAPHNRPEAEPVVRFETPLGKQMQAALVCFGGTPEHVLFDDAKSVVIERDAFGADEHRVKTN
ncbi:integrase catalytic subunit [Caballeronia glebae]|uniref:Integrase catalytic subunit n=1 Tax=Caballeronia glebae TaxID=1777143 RepID=A0A158DUY2_9BURK|nr:integrase catalytic subunit [Caballeronia glebae]